MARFLGRDLMKVYGFPEHIEKPHFDATCYGSKLSQDRAEAANAELMEWLHQQGYTGANTGAVYSMPYALICTARYMVAEGPPGSGVLCLFHLPYGDGLDRHGGDWHNPLAYRATRKDVLAKIAKTSNLPEVSLGRWTSP
jgi:hypothetical protein